MKKKGFSLIEILVVVTIIGVLSAGGFVSYSTVTRNSRDARRKADLEQIRAALEMYRSNDANSLYRSSSYTGACTSSALSYLSAYLPRIPTDPKSGYQYRCVISTTDYTLYATQENSTANCGSSGCGTTCRYSVGPVGQLCP